MLFIFYNFWLKSIKTNFSYFYVTLILVDPLKVSIFRFYFYHFLSISKSLFLRCSQQHVICSMILVWASLHVNNIMLTANYWNYFHCACLLRYSLMAFITIYTSQAIFIFFNRTPRKEWKFYWWEPFFS